MTANDDAMTMLEARQRYLDANGFDGNYGERWVKLKAGPITLYFPNAAGRRRAVKRHDLHHVATGYATTWTGEAEIAAWEIASGCGHFGWAWFLNLGGLAIGLAIAPRAVFRAFVRGRHSANLYHDGEVDDALLDRSVGDVRRALRLDRPAPAAGVADLLGFAAWSAGSLAVQLAPLLVITAIARLAMT